RRRRVSHPSIHFPRSVYFPSIKIGALGLSKFSLGAKKSSLATTTAPPSRSDARSISSVKSMLWLYLESPQRRRISSQEAPKGAEYNSQGQARSASPLVSTLKKGPEA